MKYNVISLLCLGGFLAILIALMSNFTFWGFEYAALAVMAILPLAGTVIAFFGENSFWKWMAIFHNILALCISAYIVVALLLNAGQA